MLIKSSKHIALLGAAILTGCAFTPEKVALKPTVYYKHSHIGEGKTVMLQVVDARASNILGGRPSGFGPSGKISVSSEDLIKMVAATVKRGLLANEFKVTSKEGAPSDSSLTVRVNALEYKPRMGLVTFHVDINSNVEGIVDVGSHHYDQIYRYSSTRNVMITPTAKSDAKHISAALSKSLAKLLDDEKLLKLLAS